MLHRYIYSLREGGGQWNIPPAADTMLVLHDAVGIAQSKKSGENYENINQATKARCLERKRNPSEALFDTYRQYISRKKCFNI